MPLLTAVVTAIALAAPQAPQVTRQTVPGVTNFAKLESTIACAGATSLDGIQEVKKLGYKTIINLREASETGAQVQESAAAARGAGIAYIHIPMNRNTPDTSVADEFLKVIVDPAAQPVFVHCGSGNRAAAMWMIKRMVVDKWDAGKAGIEAAALGLTNAQLKQFALDYAARKSGGQQPAPAAPAPQPPTGRGGQPQAPQFTSPEITADRRITFRLYAPDAATVSLRGGDIPAPARQNLQFTKAENGVWEATTAAVEPGAYRYTFVVNGVGVIDPRNTAISESNTTTWSVATVPGSDVMDMRNVPHGAVAAVYYQSSALGRTRRLHVYTPPGYESGKGSFPVFYLLHGAGDCDDSWTSVGRANFILDNLIASGKAKPMIVVMPAGHTNAGGGRGAAPAGGAPPRDEFGEDFVKDVMPYVEKHYRVMPGRANRAIAGLSMGGSQTLNIAIPNLDTFAYVGVYSSGLLGGGRGRGAAADAPAPPFGAAWEQANLAALDNASAKKGLKLLWFATGVDDTLIPTSRSTVELLKKHGFAPVFKETPGGHTWLNWRSYLIEFVPQLF
jgi:enterochelin esterase family protein